LNHQREFW